MFRHVQHDDLDRAPPRDALPDWNDRARPVAPRRPAPPPWLWPAAILALALACGALIWAIYPFVTLVYDLVREALDAYRIEARAVIALSALLALAALIAALWKTASAIGDLGARARIIRAPGDAPLDVRAVQGRDWNAVARDAMAAHYAVQATWAAHSDHRNLQTFAPHIVLRNEAAPAPAPAPALTLAAAPALRALLDAGEVGRGRPLLLGVDATTSEMVRGSFKSLYSAGIGGLQGSGKTWCAAFLLAQSAAHGARLVICDPHAGDGESLASRCAGLAPAMLCDVADEPRGIEAALKLVNDELDRRKRGAPDRWPLIVAIDEWLSLMRGALAATLPRLVEAVTTEGRKLNVHALLLAQRWDKAAAGEFRNTLASGYVFRLRPAEARMLTGLTAASLPGDTLALAPGQAYLLTTSGEVRKVVIPTMTTDDVAALGQQAALPVTNGAPPPRPFGFRPAEGKAGVEASGKPAGSQREAKAEAASKASGSGGSLSPEEARIVALFLAGKSVPEVILEVFNVSSGGRAYQEKRALVEKILREALKRGA